MHVVLIMCVLLVCYSFIVCIVLRDGLFDVCMLYICISVLFACVVMLLLVYVCLFYYVLVCVCYYYEYNVVYSCVWYCCDVLLF